MAAGVAMRAAVVINPVSGSGRRAASGPARADLARTVLAAQGVEADILVTRGPGEAHALARLAVERGASLVYAWGGDGTVNEVGSALAFRPVPLAVIPAGSGNGFAKSLDVSLDPGKAILGALHGRERALDVGALGGRLFFNVAGVGLDAAIAAAFNACAQSRRGLLPYITSSLRELLRHRAVEYAIDLDGVALRRRAMFVAIANMPEYGNGARIAPQAAPDDGVLDVVVVEPRWLGADAVRTIRLFRGTFDRAAGVASHRVRALGIAAARPITFHVDGEPAEGGTALEGRVYPGALRVRVGS